MNAPELIALSPLIVIAGTAILVMLAIAFHRNHILVSALTVAGLIASFGLLLATARSAPHIVTPLLVVDRYSIFYTGLLVAAGCAVTLMSFGYLETRGERAEEFYILLLLAVLGSAVLVSSNHFASFFLGLELLSVSLYPLISYQRRNPLGIEAGVKYLVLAGVSSAFLLFGMALVYADLGTLSLPEIAVRAASLVHPGVLLWTGFGLMIVGIGFKLALAPFHMWTPDVYQGAPAPVTALIATVSKGAMAALMLRYFTVVNFQQNESLVVIVAVMAVASMVAGNLLALLQNNVKRLLAYSSIAHLGYLLVAFLATGPMAMTAVAYYLVAYFVTTLGAFGVVTLMSASGEEADLLQDYEGLAWRRPWLAALFTAMLLSFAGIPLTAGFAGKFYLMAAGARSGLWWLLIVLVVTSAIGLFYYLRVIISLYKSPVPQPAISAVKPSLSLAGTVTLAILMVFLVWLGVYPAPVINLIQTMAAGVAWQ